MQRTLPILAAALALAGCIQQSTRPGRPLDVVRITPEAPSLVYYSGLRDPLRMAVFDQAALVEVWERAFKSRDPMPAPPQVDFSRDFVVVVALGERSSGGFAIKVARAFAKGAEVAAEIVATAPGKGCVVSMAMSQPVDFVKIPRPGTGAVNVHFVDWLVAQDCGR